MTKSPETKCGYHFLPITWQAGKLTQVKERDATIIQGTWKWSF